MADDDRRPSERSAEARREDHAAIARLADDLLPALVAKLGASGLGELEVREGSWKVRIRMPERRGGRRGSGRPATEAGRSATAPAPAPGSGAAAEPGGHVTAAARGQAASAFDPGTSATAGGSTAQAARIPVAVVEDLDADEDATASLAAGPRRAIATSPAVGFFRPLVGMSSGARIRAGDRVGMVDVLGVGQEVLAPVDGRVGATLVEPGEPVEYGQEVVEIELLPNGTGHGAGWTRVAAEDGAPAGDDAASGGGASGGDARSNPGASAPALPPEATA